VKHFYTYLPENCKIGKIVFGRIGTWHGCQKVCFQTKNPNFGKILRALEYKMLLYFMTFLNILWLYDIIYSVLVQFGVIWYIFSVLVCLDQEKSGNPAPGSCGWRP
jgi:hypothetical protein